MWTPSAKRLLTLTTESEVATFQGTLQFGATFRGPRKTVGVEDALEAEITTAAPSYTSFILGASEG
jgi:hypothetical protein